MDNKQLSAFACEAVKDFKSEVDVAAFTHQLDESFYETALTADLDGHPGHDRHQASTTRHI